MCVNAYDPANYYVEYLDLNHRKTELVTRELLVRNPNRDEFEQQSIRLKDL